MQQRSPAGLKVVTLWFMGGSLTSKGPLSIKVFLNGYVSWKKATLHKVLGTKCFKGELHRFILFKVCFQVQHLEKSSTISFVSA